MDSLEAEQLSHDLALWCVPFPLCAIAQRMVRHGVRPHVILHDLVPLAVPLDKAVSKQQYVLLARYLGRANAYQVMHGREP